MLDHQDLLERILARVDASAYLPLADAVEPHQKAAMTEIERAIRDPSAPPDEVRAVIEAAYAARRINEVMRWSALHVLAASPRVNDPGDAARCVAEQEMAALRLGGPNLENHLASVDRHRGVLAFQHDQVEVALDYFTRAFERQRTAGNLANVLAALLRLGEIERAEDLLSQVRSTLPQSLVEALDQMVEQDPDLALLRFV